MILVQTSVLDGWITRVINAIEKDQHSDQETQ
jgi:hypothetical protein